MCRHQAGWFPFNLDNEMQLPGERANPDDPDGEPRNEDLQEMASGFYLKQSILSAVETGWNRLIALMENTLYNLITLDSFLCLK